MKDGMAAVSEFGTGANIHKKTMQKRTGKIWSRVLQGARSVLVVTFVSSIVFASQASTHDELAVLKADAEECNLARAGVHDAIDSCNDSTTVVSVAKFDGVLHDRNFVALYEKYTKKNYADAIRPIESELKRADRKFRVGESIEGAHETMVFCLKSSLEDLERRRDAEKAKSIERNRLEREMAELKLKLSEHEKLAKSERAQADKERLLAVKSRAKAFAGALESILALVEETQEAIAGREKNVRAEIAKEDAAKSASKKSASNASSVKKMPKRSSAVDRSDDCKRRNPSLKFLFSPTGRPDYDYSGYVKAKNWYIDQLRYKGWSELSFAVYPNKRDGDSVYLKIQGEGSDDEISITCENLKYLTYSRNLDKGFAEDLLKARVTIHFAEFSSRAGAYYRSGRLESVRLKPDEEIDLFSLDDFYDESYAWHGIKLCAPTLSNLAIGNEKSYATPATIVLGLSIEPFSRGFCGLSWEQSAPRGIKARPCMVEFNAPKWCFREFGCFDKVTLGYDDLGLYNVKLVKRIAGDREECERLFSVVRTWAEKRSKIPINYGEVNGALLGLSDSKYRQTIIVRTDLPGKSTDRLCLVSVSRPKK